MSSSNTFHYKTLYIYSLPILSNPKFSLLLSPLLRPNPTMTSTEVQILIEFIPFNAFFCFHILRLYYFFSFPLNCLFVGGGESGSDESRSWKSCLCGVCVCVLCYSVMGWSCPPFYGGGFCCSTLRLHLGFYYDIPILHEMRYVWSFWTVYKDITKFL